MTQVYEVEFRPDEERDYIQDIVFNTDEGTFAVAVVGKNMQRQKKNFKISKFIKMEK